LKELSDSVFFASGLKTIQIPGSIEKIRKECFQGCEFLCKVVFESNSKLEGIGDFAFLHSGIKTIRIPSNVKNIGECSFSYCKSLSEITFEGSPFIGIETFSDCPLEIPI
jgi:hypothetical protein